MSDNRRSRTRSLLGFSGKRTSLLFGNGDIQESHEEKEAHKVRTKADPTKAVNEPQPAAWTFEKSTIASLRSIEHRDSDGNPIADPDASNPTRSRLERPLDTIRSFEAAIENSYNRRPMSRAASGNAGPHLRPHSYNQGPTYAQRSPIDGRGYNGNRTNSRPSSYVENYPPNYGRRFGPSHRIASDPVLYGQSSQGVYPSQGYQQSYDTVASASINGSGGTDPWGNSTDPSSENSSIDRVQQAPKPDAGEQYGLNGFGGVPQYQGPILEEHSQDSPGYGQPGYGQSHTAARGGFPFQGNDVPPPPPPHMPPKQNAPRTPIKLGGSAAPAPVSPPSGTSEKRKSWLKRRFSKSQ